MVVEKYYGCYFFDVDHAALQTELVRSGLGLVGFKFLGATQATQTFNTYDSIMEAFESNVFE